MASSTTCEIVWLLILWLLADMSVYLRQLTSLYCDNESVIQIARNSVFHERTKHIEIVCHITCHHLQFETIIFSFVLSSLQIADMCLPRHERSVFMLSFFIWHNLYAFRCNIVSFRRDVSLYIYLLLLLIILLIEGRLIFSYILGF